MKRDYLAEAKLLAKSGHNMFVLSAQGYEFAIPGDMDGTVTGGFIASFMSQLHSCIVLAYKQDQDVPDFLPLEHGAKLDIRPWKMELKETKVEGG